MAQAASAHINAIKKPVTAMRRGADSRSSEGESVGEGCASPP